MTVIYKDTEVTAFMMPKMEALFIEFLIKHGYKPQQSALDKQYSIVRVSKRYYPDLMTPKWQKFNGTDKTLKKLLERYK